jgi:hypothetical protein
MTTNAEAKTITFDIQFLPPEHPIYQNREPKQIAAALGYQVAAAACAIDESSLWIFIVCAPPELVAKACSELLGSSRLIEERPTGARCAERLAASPFVRSVEPLGANSYRVVAVPSPAIESARRDGWRNVVIS